jgi:hypothetical protein
MTAADADDAFPSPRRFVDPLDTLERQDLVVRRVKRGLSRLKPRLGWLSLKRREIEVSGRQSVVQW